MAHPHRLTVSALAAHRWRPGCRKLLDRTELEYLGWSNLGSSILGSTILAWSIADGSPHRKG
jgi:hypothetical protein